MTRERFIKLMEITKTEREFVGCKIFAGLKIITKYVPKEGIEAVGHDIVYSSSIDDLLLAGITEEEVTTLRKLNWMVDEFEEGLAHFV